MNGAEILIQCLIEEKVEHIFGYPGGSLLYVYDAIGKQNNVKHVLVRHEQGAAHAADAYSRSSGKVGVCLFTSGPGITNAVSGIATAYMDSIPLIIISGQAPTYSLGLDAFQEVDAVGITRSCVKHNFLVKNVNDIPEIVKKAFYIATTGRPGPVLIDIPKDISGTPFNGEFSYPLKVDIRSYEPPKDGHLGQIKKAAKLIADAKQPLIYTGGGVILADAAKQIIELTELLNVPITNTLMGLGSYPGRGDKFLGMLGMHGTYEANMATQNCDVLIAIGARFDDRVIGNPKDFKKENRKIIHIDIDPTSISKRVKVDVPIVGDVKSVVTTLISYLTENNLHRSIDEVSRKEWWQKIQHWRDVNCLFYDKASGSIKPQSVIEMLTNLPNSDEFYITSDVGQHQMWAAQYFKFQRPRRWINSGGLGTMGFGLPAAIGVQIANPNATVFCITGDGSIQMAIKELSTCKQYKLPIKIICLNNNYLGMVRQQQQLFHGNRESQSYVDAMPDFVKLAEAYGHVGIRVEKNDQIEPALKEALTITDRSVFIDILTDRLEGVFPMVAAGKGLEEMIMGPEQSVGCD